MCRIVLFDTKIDTPLSISANSKQRNVFHFLKTSVRCLDEKRAAVTPWLISFAIKFCQKMPKAYQALGGGGRGEGSEARMTKFTAAIQKALIL